MNNIKKTKWCVLIVLVIFLFGFSYLKNESINMKLNEYSKDHESEERCDSTIGITQISEDGKVDESFESHLPLVVIDVGEEEIPTAYKYSEVDGYVVPIEGVNPYIPGHIDVYDNGSRNKLTDEVTQQSNIEIKYRGNSSLSFDKKQYKINLVTKDGGENPLPILDLEEDDEWVLNISMADPSLLRNYIAYTIGAQIDGFTPDVKYCEVIFKDGDTYQYQGLYLMAENVKKSHSRVDISSYNPKNTYSSYLLRRDRFDPEAITLDTYATKEVSDYGYLAVEYPPKWEMTDQTKQYIEEKISNFEKILYSKDKATFSKYDQYINEDSFVNYFLLNEFFGNYDAGTNSTYIYSDLDGRINMGPIWDFDTSMDNYKDGLMVVDQISFRYQTWFEQLCTSKSFNEKLLQEYRELRQSVFSDQYVETLIDETVAYLGNAQLRDWSRWHTSYENYKLNTLKDTEGVEIDRNYATYDENVQRLKDVLYEHANIIEEKLQYLIDGSSDDDRLTRYGGLAVVFVIIFLVSVVTSRRK